MGVYAVVNHTHLSRESDNLPESNTSSLCSSNHPFNTGSPVIIRTVNHTHLSRESENLPESNTSSLCSSDHPFNTGSPVIIRTVNHTHLSRQSEAMARLTNSCSIQASQSSKLGFVCLI